MSARYCGERCSARAACCSAPAVSIGAAFGVYGQLLISHALATVTGFPIVFSAGALVAISSFAFVSVVSLAIVGLLGYRAAGVPPNV